MAEIRSYKVAGIMDTAGFSKGIDKMQQELRRLAQFTKKTRADIETYDLAPIRKVNYSQLEQAVRDEQAMRIKAMRSAAFSSRVKDEVSLRMFGMTADAYEKSGKDAAEGTARGFFGRLDRIAGENSTFGKTMKLLAGAGAVGALSVAANEFNELTKKAENLAVAMSRGPDETRRMTAELLTSIPIVGKLGEGFGRVWDIALGTASEVARIEESTRDLEAVTAAIARNGKAAADSAMDTAKFVEAERNTRELMGKTGYIRELISLNHALSGKRSSINEDAAGRIKAIVDQDLIELNQLRSKLSNTIVPEHRVHLNEFGGVEEDNQAQVDAAVARREELSSRIREIESSQAKAIARINDDAATKLAQAQRTDLAGRVQATKDAWRSVLSFVDDVFDGFGKRIKKDTEQALKVAKETNEATEKMMRDRRLEEVTRIKDNFEAAKRIIDQSKTSSERMMDNLAEIRRLGGLGLLSEAQMVRAIDYAGRDVVRRDTFNVPSGDRVASGFGVTLDYFRTGSKDKTAEDALAEAKATAKATAATAKALEKTKPVGVFSLN